MKLKKLLIYIITIIFTYILAIYNAKLGLLLIITYTIIFLMQEKLTKKENFIFSLIISTIFISIQLIWIINFSILPYILAVIYFSIPNFLFFITTYTIIKSSLNDTEKLIAISSIFTLIFLFFDKLEISLPWLNPIYSLYKYNYFLSLLDIFGPYFYNFIFISLSYLIYNYYIKRKKINIYIIFFIILIPLIYANTKIITTNYDKEKTIKINIVQPNLTIKQKWAKDRLYKNVNLYKTMSNKKADIIIWPETSITTYLNTNNKMLNYIKEITLNYLNNSLLITGCLTNNDEKIYNSIYIIKNSKILDIYRKTHLVPLGEYIPAIIINTLGKLTFFKAYLKQISHFSKGRRYITIKYKDFKLSTTICFESLYPYISRQISKKNIDIIINISNDIWFKHFKLPYEQHLAVAVFRAIENKIYFIQSANNGYSFLINQNGKIEKISNLYKRQSILFEVYKIKNKKQTLYTKFSDTPIILITLIALIFIIIKRKIYV